MRSFLAFLSAVTTVLTGTMAIADSSSGTTAQTKYVQTQIAAPGAAIFKDYSTKSITLTAPFSDLFSKRSSQAIMAGDRSVTKQEISGLLKIDSFALPVRIRMRGFATLNDCSFPKMTLKFDKKSTVGTPFAGLHEVDLGTHCAAAVASRQKYYTAAPFNHREALFYKWLKILDIPAYAAKPIVITYQDTSQSVMSGDSALVTTAQGFLLETLSDFLKRSGGIEIRSSEDIFHPGQVETATRKIEYKSIGSSSALDLDELARIALFESFIGNWDWSLDDQYIRNLKLVQLPSGSWLPIPLDFNSACMTTGDDCGDLVWASSIALEAKKNTFNLVSSRRQIEIINEFESHKADLEKSLSALSDDPAGLQLFRNQLSIKFKDLESLKRNLLHAP